MIETNKLYEFCVYTMRHQEDLGFVLAGDRKATFREKKSWKTARTLFEDSKYKSRQMPIFFSAADEQSGIIYVALIENILIDSEKVTNYTFSNLMKLRNAKPLSSLILKRNATRLSDNYIRPYAICKTPSQLSSWLKETGLPPIIKKRKTGQEPVHHRGASLGPSLNDFWQWSASDLVSNATRGVLAEFLVATALGLADGIRSEWDAYDLLLPSGHKVEVKSSAYIQSWYQRELSKISFSVPETLAWYEQDNRQAKYAKRQADIYVFCILKHKIQETLDPLNVNQWKFYVVPTSTLNEHLGNTKQIGLSTLRKIEPCSVLYSKLRQQIEKIAEKIDIT